MITQNQKTRKVMQMLITNHKCIELFAPIDLYRFFKAL
jgi:hypothetical protein